MLWLPIDSAFFSIVVLLAEGLEVLWGEDSPFLMGEVVLIGAVGYYFVAWSLVGRDRHKADGGPKHEPPTGYSPAALRYLWSIEDCPVGFDDGAFTTVVVGLAGKGVVTIEQNGSTFLLHDRGVGTAELLPDEEAVYRTLFHDPGPREDAPRESLTLGYSKHRDFFRVAIAGLKTQLDEQLKRGEAFRKNNRGWVWIGVLISLCGAGLLNMDPLITEFLADFAGSAEDMSSGMNAELLIEGAIKGAFGAFFSLFGALVIFLLCGSFILLRRRDMGPGLGIGALGVLFGVVLVQLMLQLYSGAGFLRVAAWMLFGYVLNVRGANLLKRYSRKGRMVQDYIEGLQMYMGGEGQRAAEQAYGPAMNAEHHDQLLPYAVALGRAGSWSRQFEIQLESRKEAGAPSGGFGGDLAGPEIGKTLAVNGEFHKALKLSC